MIRGNLFEACLKKSDCLVVRVQFIQDYTLKSMRLKPEKWAKLVISDEQRRHLENFVDKDLPQVLIISQNIGGQLQIHSDWPSTLRYGDMSSVRD